MDGRGIILFFSPRAANRAFSSPLLTGTDGRNGVRVWWYQGTRDGKKKPKKRQESVKRHETAPEPSTSPVMTGVAPFMDRSFARTRPSAASSERQEIIEWSQDMDVDVPDHTTPDILLHPSHQMGLSPTLAMSTLPSMHVPAPAAGSRDFGLDAEGAVRVLRTW